MADTLPSETVTPESLSNDGQPVATTTVVNAPDAEVERLKKEAEQARMRANQAQNELDRIKAEQDAARAKQLEEKEEFKVLYEQTQSQLNEIRENQAAQERQTQLSTATQEVFKDYSANVVELAKTAGLSLTEDSDEARTALKGKLDIFQAQVGGTTPKAGASNPRQTTPNPVSREELVTRNAEGVSPMALSMARGDESVVRSYIREIPAIQRMKEIARGGM